MAFKGTNNDWVLIGDYIKSELQRRVSKRLNLEALWKEVDRKIPMRYSRKADKLFL